MNNYERIRSMSLKDLAVYINKRLDTDYCRSRKCQNDCIECTVSWLESEVIK